ncbi:hypothetical protein [Oricola sp.]|uniref:hypothetical protein n=1 Tax=Oricola sp. TaxID=1979950 RepID=UPI0025E2C273|nr:hypothetical protein [Oricola sp.]MCI5078570.1 hypothetical protein [Oricola sp.]
MLTAYFDRLASPAGILLLLAGAFYVFAGWFACRHIRTEMLIDRALDALGGAQPDAADRARTIWLLAGTVVTFASGASLVALSSLAIWAFVAGFLQQVVYILVAAPRYFDVDEPPDPRGRRQTTNAAIIYGVVAVGVIFAGARGALLPVAGAGLPATVAVALAVAGFVVWMVYGVKASRDVASPLAGLDLDAGEDAEDDVALADLVALRLSAEQDQWPLEAVFHDGQARRVSPQSLFDAADLCRDLLAWQDRFDDIFEPLDLSLARDWTPEEEQAHFREARALAERLRDEIDEIGFTAIAVSYAAIDGSWIDARQPG